MQEFPLRHAFSHARYDFTQDLQIKQKHLVTFSVGYDMRMNIDIAIKKLIFLSVSKISLSQFSENFTILLFHYDGRTSEWDELEWSKKAIHVSAIKQTKWCVDPDSISQHLLFV
ncbi:hypothetical protein ZIOFF_039445 [Zingiber officinale]|uniref:Uncharacterized protein n=1 Tax=Zingiber officinale TaxID=94328 RepID=A0A8J5G177_ZINOF|nr:hypothetical protein ZIOFF_039445 [Zingiber officinale]